MKTPAWLTPWRYCVIPDGAATIMLRFPRLQSLLYRFRCPYPIIEDRSVRACIDAGHCGCDNKARYTNKRT